jgi:hypothetical protein
MALKVTPFLMFEGVAEAARADRDPAEKGGRAADFMQGVGRGGGRVDSWTSKS